LCWACESGNSMPDTSKEASDVADGDTHEIDTPVDAEMLPNPDATGPGDTSDWRPFPPSEMYEGRRLTEWATEWVRWHYAQTDCSVDTAFDADGSFCDYYQKPESPVFFLDSGMPVTTRTECVIPAGKAIVLPLADDIIDNAGVAVEEQWTEQEMTELITSEMESMRDFMLTVDGVAIDNLSEWSVETTQFDYELPPEPNWYSCNGMPGVTGKVMPAFFNGYFVVLPPPSPGTHTLEYASTLTSAGHDYSAHVKTTFTVE
jgi:hypothetical protein